MRRTRLIAVVIGTLLAVASEGWARPPRVIKAVPDNGDQNVDPSLREIRVTFDQDMIVGENYSWVGGGPSYPKTRGKPKWVDARTCVLSVRLEPNHEYWLSINSDTFKNFRSKRGAPATPYPISFRTGSGKGDAKAQRGSSRRRTRSSRRSSRSSGKRNDGRLLSTERSGQKLTGTLQDTFGREVRGSDYVGVPVLLLSGACWCGGCQQDMHAFKALADKYGSDKLQLIRSSAGDNELVTLEFQRHYRSQAVHLLDVNREFERQFHRNGWSFVMLVDKAGRVVCRANNSLGRLMGELEPLLKKATESDASVTPVMLDGVAYTPATAKRSGESEGVRQCDRFPAIACGGDGRVHVVFTSNRNGNNDVFMRTFDGENWGKDRAIAASDADEFDGHVVVDGQGRIWVSWTSNAETENYNVFVACLADAGESVEPVRITDADDDAMHARLASDREAGVWVTYYKWHKMGNLSRDKEVYVRRHDGTDWSQEVRVSPTDVPNYEDHTDPTIASCDQGVIVCWSWDYHRPKGYTRDAQNPTVFIRPVDRDLELGKIQHASLGTGFDAAPSVVVDEKDRIWCAWESLQWHRPSGASRKWLCAGSCDLAGSKRPDPKNVRGPQRNICTPRLAVGPDGAVALVWAECTTANRWSLKQATFEAGRNRWSRARTLDSAGAPRFPTIGYGVDGHLWVAYSKATEEGRRIVVKDLAARGQ